MKAFIMMSTLLLILSGGCDRNKGKGSDTQWQQRQEQMEEDKKQDIEELDRQMEKEQDTREVKINHVEPAN